MSAVKVHLGCTTMLSDATIHIRMCIQAHTYGPDGCRLLDVLRQDVFPPTIRKLLPDCARKYKRGAMILNTPKAPQVCVSYDEYFVILRTIKMTNHRSSQLYSVRQTTSNFQLVVLVSRPTSLLFCFAIGTVGSQQEDTVEHFAAKELSEVGGDQKQS